MTGASVTNKGIVNKWHSRHLFDGSTSGIYYDAGKEPPLEGPPKLHLLIESNEEWRVSGCLVMVVEHC